MRLLGYLCKVTILWNKKFYLYSSYITSYFKHKVYTSTVVHIWRTMILYLGSCPQKFDASDIIMT